MHECAHVDGGRARRVASWTASRFGSHERANGLESFLYGMHVSKWMERNAYWFAESEQREPGLRPEHPEEGDLLIHFMNPMYASEVHAECK